MKGTRLVTAVCMILILLNLTGCRRGKDSLRGEVVQVFSDENMLLLENGGEKTLILWEEDTLVGSWMESADGRGILDGTLKTPSVRVMGEEMLGKETLNAERYPGFRAEQIFLEAVWEEDAYTLADGSRLDLRRSDEWKTFYTKEGRALLTERRPVGPHNVSVINMLGYDQLGEEAKRRISDWYDRQGLLYDLDQELERAWQEFQTCEEPLLFQSYHAGQEIFPGAYNEELIWFSTSVTTTIDQKSGTDTQTCQAFRRQTGEPVDMASLFRCPEDRILERLLDAALGSGNDRGQLRRAFRMEYLIFDRERLLIWFPAGTLPSEEYTWILSVRYQDLEDVLWDWAIPKGQMEAGA